jgi:hypothetical protein
MLAFGGCLAVAGLIYVASMGLDAVIRTQPSADQLGSAAKKVGCAWGLAVLAGLFGVAYIALLAR